MRALLLLLVLASAAWSQPYQPSLKLLDPVRYLGEPRPGFLTAGHGGFRWQDGSRAHFWGVNVANRNLWIPGKEIDVVVEAMARSGVNLVRFEALDSRGGMLEIPGKPGTRKINPQKLRTLHYWISKLHQKKIHYYFDLIDFRDFAPEDGVENAKAIGRAARPYAVFDEKLIELQKEYATQLLTTRNPFTKLKPVEDPYLALLEICNESGFFLYAKVTDNLVEPYRTGLQKKWNAWLRARYNREQLANRWGPALGDGEDPGADTVRLPHLTGSPDAQPRQSDGVEFLCDTQKAYFTTMLAHLRGLGLKIPVTAVVSSDIPCDVESVAAVLDFTSENHYVDHPSFGGADWQGKYYYQNKNGLRDPSRFGFAPFTGQLRWGDKPVVVREWATTWPNGFRAGSIPEAAAYARLQDFDGMILFGYKTGADGPRLVEFGFQSDPTVWGLFSLGAMIFMRGDVAVATSVAFLEYGKARLLQPELGVPDLVRLAYTYRLSSGVEGGRMPVGDLTVWPVQEMAQSADEWLTQAPVDGGGTALEGGRYTSRTGQIIRDTSRGRLLVTTLKTCLVAGELSGDTLRAGPLELASSSGVGALVATSLDGFPLTSSRQVFLKMVTIAENTGQQLLPAPPGAPGPFVLDQPGAAPVKTFGDTEGGTTEVRLGGHSVIEMQLVNGTWELLAMPDGTTFWCDTPGVRLSFGGRMFTTGKEPIRLR